MRPANTAHVARYRFRIGERELDGGGGVLLLVVRSGILDREDRGARNRGGAAVRAFAGDQAEWTGKQAELVRCGFREATSGSVARSLTAPRFQHPIGPDSLT